MRSGFNYSQGVFGNCGHVCDAWPQLRRWEGSSKANLVICDVCTRESFGIDEAEVLAVWVRVAEEPEETKPAAKKKTPRKKKLCCSLCRKDHLYSDCPLIAVELPYGT